jgi:regulator of protease activity HflC (stomatin/prohibitin superfamily)
MESQAGLPLWVLLVAPLLGLAVVSLLRWVAPGERLVVLRRGLVARLHGPGPAWRLPGIEHAVYHPDEMPATPLAVRARTRDARQVFLGLEADLQTLPPDVGQRYTDPAYTAEEVIARVVTTAVAGLDVHELPGGLVSQIPRLRDEADRTTRRHGVAVRTLQIVELDVILALDDQPPNVAATDQAACGSG